jgi:perosamine synthetase
VKYPINEPSISKLEGKYVNDVLQSGWLSAGGKHTREFEKKFAEYIGSNYALAVQSGTAALHLALKAVGISSGDNIIIPNYSCGATISTVIQCGAKPIVMDIEPDTYGLDVDALEHAIKTYDPKAVQLVHVYGFPARDTLKIKKLCNEHDIILIEDASEALGATIDQEKIGTIGDIATFSIRSEKMIGVGEGGVVVTNNSDLYKETLKLASRNSPFRGNDSDYWEKYYYDGEGYNYLLPHLLGAVARAQIERFPEILTEKKRVGESFRSIFEENEYWRLQYVADDSSSVFWLNTILFKELDTDSVRKLGQHLEKNGVEVRSGFIPLSNMSGFKSESCGGQEIAHELYNRLLVLPSASWLKESDLCEIHKIIINFLNSMCKSS